jgi:hypothetical protein
MSPCDQLHQSPFLLADVVSGYKANSVILGNGGVAKIDHATRAVDERQLVLLKIDHHVSGWDQAFWLG